MVNRFMRWPGMALLLLTPVGARAQAEACAVSGTAYRDLIHEHVARYPGLAVQDLYKLLHQASLGSGHAMADTAVVRAWMVREVAALGDGPDEPVFDTLGVGGRYARVHLRPYLAAGGRAEPLLGAFVETANRAPPDVGLLACARTAAVGLARAGALPWTAAEVERFFLDQEQAGNPAVHHSAVFAARYRPAYRVVSVDLLRPLARGPQ